MKTLMRYIAGKARLLAGKAKRLLILGCRPPVLLRYFQAYKERKNFIKLPVILKHINSLKIEFATSETPKVSIIMPVYNNIAYTFNCLKSIHENMPVNIAYEFMVVDDCSTDVTQLVLSKIKGLRVIKNTKKSYFFASCNQASDQARGEYLLFLNNDTRVTHGWLEWLLRTFEEFPDAGLVGSKLIFPNGLLQEAGGIVWKDGSAHNYGRMDDPNKPEYNYLREVDYCSGACIMMPRGLFVKLGKFDDRYFPAYYDDTDMAFKVRSCEKKVLYQPNSVVIHHEGVTLGTDLSSGVKKYQVINQAKFYDKWKAVLAGQAERGSAVEQAKERGIKKRMLVIDECVCRPDRDAASARMFYLLKIIHARGYKITFCASNNDYPQPYTNDMRCAGIEILDDSGVKRVEKYLKANGKSFDAVILSRLKPAEKYMELVRKYCSNAKIIYDTVDLHFLRESRGAAVAADHAKRQNAEKLKRTELGIIARSDLALAVSQAEKARIKEALPDTPVKIVPTVYEVHGGTIAFEERKDLLFIGGFGHSPNIDAVKYLMQAVFPVVRERLPGVKLFVVGSDPPREVKELAAEDVIVTGFVKEIKPYLDRCRLSVAPLRYGAGVKGKINLSMSYGLPVVATSVAVEGMRLTNREDVLVAKDSAEFAAAVVELYTDQDLWEKLSCNGRENVRKYFSVDYAQKALAEVFDSVGR